MPPILSTVASGGCVDRKRRTGRPSAPAAKLRRKAPTRAPRSPATGSQGEFSAKQVRGDDRPQDGAQREPTQGERLGGEPTVRAENGERRDPEQQENVDDVHEAQSSGERSLDDQVDELARDDDLLADLLAVHVGAHARELLRARDQLGLGEPDRHLDLVPHPPVHLHDQLERLALEQGRVGLRPGLRPTGARARAAPRAPRPGAARRAGSG